MLRPSPGSEQKHHLLYYDLPSSAWDDPEQQEESPAMPVMYFDIASADGTIY